MQLSNEIYKGTSSQSILRIGIDQSLSSTGISIVEGGKLIKSYLITNKPPKKKFLQDRYKLYDHLSWKFELMQYIPYISEDVEMAKTGTVMECADMIVDVVCQYAFYNKVEVTLEGISFSSRNTSRLDELSALNYLIRERLISHHIPFRVITPSTNKKVFTGNGCATKDLMAESFLKLNPEFEVLRGYVKLDDIADSFALATYK